MSLRQGIGNIKDGQKRIMKKTTIFSQGDRFSVSSSPESTFLSESHFIGEGLHCATESRHHQTSILIN